MSGTFSFRIALVIVALAGGFALAPVTAEAQGWGDRLKKKAKAAVEQKVEERAEQRAGEATEATLDHAECAATDSKCGQGNVTGTSAAGATPASGATAASGATTDAGNADKPGEGAWRNYDFVPGNRVLVAEDFADDNVGDFPKHLTFKSGNLEVVEWKGARFLSTNTFGAEFSVPLPEVLPERFTLEFDYSATSGNGTTIYFVDPSTGRSKSHVELGTTFGGVRGGGVDAIGQPGGNQYKYQDVVFPVRIMADGKYVKVYMGDTRVANVPNADLGRSKAIYFNVPGRPERAAMIGNIRVASGGKKLYDALAAIGRVATQGIYFDVGSDRIRPESTPTLKEIGAMLAENPALKLTIEGHTDNVGDAAANKALSARRADAVRAYLVSQHKVDAARLQAVGMGAEKPVAPNTTPAGRQANRRVELVKM